MDLLTAALRWLADPVDWTGPDGIPVRLGEHLAISMVSLLVAVAVALPAGLWIGHTGRGARLAIGLANLGRAVPTFAVMGMAIPFTAALDPQAGFSLYPTVLAMVLLAVPPILVNAYAGIHEVDRDLVEAGRGMGFREREVLIRIELPVALPVVVGGIRSAASQVLATATLGAILGLGGLGRYLIDGLANHDTGETWAGVFLVAALVLATEGAFALGQRALTSPGLRHGRVTTSPV